MVDVKRSEIPHRIRPDGMYESICILCLATVASANSLEELHARHEGHVCRPVVWAKDYLPNCPS
jgi:hypothetical protein